MYARVCGALRGTGTSYENINPAKNLSIDILHRRGTRCLINIYAMYYFEKSWWYGKSGVIEFVEASRCIAGLMRASWCDRLCKACGQVPTCFFVAVGYNNPARHLNISSAWDVQVSGRVGITHCYIFHPCIAHEVSHLAKLALRFHVHLEFYRGEGCLRRFVHQMKVNCWMSSLRI